MSAGCYGFDIKSEIDLRFLRDGNGDLLEIHRLVEMAVNPTSRPVMRFTPTPRNPVRADLYALREPGVFNLIIEHGDKFHIDTVNGRIGVMPGPDPVRTEERLWGFPSLLSFLKRADIPLHGASVDVGGKALLLCAPSRHGKTTLAAGFHRAGHRLLAEDLSCVRLREAAFALPGPASLRVRHDMVEPLSLDDVELLADDDDRYHFAIASHRRGTSEPVPISGVILLKDEAKEISVERADPQAAIQDLWFLSFNLPYDDDRARCFAGLADLCARVPVWNLTRPMRFDALDETVGRLVELADADE